MQLENMAEQPLVRSPGVLLLGLDLWFSQLRAMISI